MGLLSTPEVADRLGVTIARVQQMIWEGQLPAQKVGRDYVIEEENLKLVEHRPRGRPPKAKPDTASGQDGRVIVTKKRGAKK